MSNKNVNNIFSKLLNLIVYTPKENNAFVLEENVFDSYNEKSSQPNEESNQSNASDNTKNNSIGKKALKTAKKIDSNENPSKETPINSFSKDININLEIIKKDMNYSDNADLKIREFTIANEEKTKAFCIYYEHITNPQSLEAIFKSLMIPEVFDRVKTSPTCEMLPNEIIRNSEINIKNTLNEATNSLITGQSLFFFDGCDYALTAETKTFSSRGIEKPSNESNIFGAKEAFVEGIKPNISMLRRMLKNKNFIIERIPIGNVNNNNCFVLYIKDIANPSLVDEVKRRLKSIEIDLIYTVDTLEQCIEDNPYSLFPLSLITERPDRVCANISDGRVGILLDNCPSAIIVPSNVTSHLQTTDDTNTRFLYATFTRIFRSLGIYLSLLLPAIYISLVNYHHDMIPTDLLISIEGARENVPFPTIVEVLLMDTLFEVIREASIRVPGIVGTTIGIIGALILGEAAVSAKLVSPILVVIIAATGIGSFTNPSYKLGVGIRIIRFNFTISSYLFGFYGIALNAFVVVGILCSQKSFGVPIFVPNAPLVSNLLRDGFIRLPIWKQNTRPDFLQAQKKYTMDNNLRKWDPKNPDNGKE